MCNTESVLLRSRFRLSLACGVTFLAGCLSPTLPLPPPEQPDSIGLSADVGEWSVRGSCAPGAVVLVRNLETGVISGTEDKDSDGRYLVRVEANKCDSAEVFQLLDNDVSDGTFFIVESLVNGEPGGNCPTQ